MNPKIAIKKIHFLVPVHIEYTVDGIATSVKARLNLAGQEVFLENPQEHPDRLSELVFPFITNSTHIREDEYEANDEVYSQANKAEGDYQNAHKQHVGDLDE